MKKKIIKKGFTLIELVVVIAVVAILTAVSVGTYFGVTKSANESKLTTEAKAILTHLKLVSLSPDSKSSSFNEDGLEIYNFNTFKYELCSSIGKEYEIIPMREEFDFELSTIRFLKLNSSEYYNTFDYFSNEVKDVFIRVNVQDSSSKILNFEDRNINIEFPPYYEINEDIIFSTDLDEDNAHLVANYGFEECSNNLISNENNSFKDSLNAYPNLSFLDYRHVQSKRINNGVIQFSGGDPKKDDFAYLVFSVPEDVDFMILTIGTYNNNQSFNNFCFSLNNVKLPRLIQFTPLTYNYLKIKVETKSIKHFILSTTTECRTGSLGAIEFYKRY